jgi:hypothetical protein
MNKKSQETVVVDPSTYGLPLKSVQHAMIPIAAVRSWPHSRLEEGHHDQEN